MISKKREREIYEVITDAFLIEYEFIDNPPEAMNSSDFERFSLLCELENRLKINIENLISGWKK